MQGGSVGRAENVEQLYKKSIDLIDNALEKFGTDYPS